MKKIILHTGITVGFIILDVLLILFVPVIPPFFSILAAFLFNPLYGGAANAAHVIIRYIINPDGAYIILALMVIIMFAEGFLIGILWKLIRDRKQLPYQIVTVCIPVLLIIGGLLTATKIKYAVYIAVFTAVFLISDIIIGKISNAEKSGNFIKIFLCIAVMEFITVLLGMFAYYDRFDIATVIATVSQTLFASAGISYIITIIKNKIPV